MCMESGKSSLNDKRMSVAAFAAARGSSVLGTGLSVMVSKSRDIHGGMSLMFGGRRYGMLCSFWMEVALAVHEVL